MLLQYCSMIPIIINTLLVVLLCHFVVIVEDWCKCLVLHSKLYVYVVHICGLWSHTCKEACYGSWILLSISTQNVCIAI